MKCVHTETTAVLAAFGEAPPEFEDHLAGCAACRQVVSEHLQTLSIIDSTDVEMDARTPSRWNPYAAGFLVAAGMLLAVQLGQHHGSTTDPSVHHQAQTTVTTEQAPFDIPLDDELASIEMELALFNLEET